MTQFDKNIETIRNELFTVLFSTQYYCCHYKCNQINYGSCNKRLRLLLIKSPFKFVLHKTLPICVPSCYMKLLYTIPSKFKIGIKKYYNQTNSIYLIISACTSPTEFRPTPLLHRAKEWKLF